jgi:uncharacterized paraquat-inducible protein A
MKSLDSAETPSLRIDSSQRESGLTQVNPGPWKRKAQSTCIPAQVRTRPCQKCGADGDPNNKPFCTKCYVKLHASVLLGYSIAK